MTKNEFPANAPTPDLQLNPKWLILYCTLFGYWQSETQMYHIYHEYLSLL